MRAIDFLQALPIFDATTALSVALPHLAGGTPVAYENLDAWWLLRPVDAVAFPGTRQLCDLPSQRLETLRLEQELDLDQLAGCAQFGALDGTRLVGRVDSATVLQAWASHTADPEAQLAALARDRLMPKLLHDLSNALMVAEQGFTLADDSDARPGAQHALGHASSLVVRMRTLYAAAASRPAAPEAAYMVVQRIEPMLQVAAQPAGLTVECAPSLTTLVPAWRLESILLNLVLNAAEHASQVTVLARADGTTLSIVVRDNGPGFSAAPAPAVRSGDALRGHGLASVRRNVLMMGGHIAFNGAPGGGAEVTIRLPDRG